ncbi:MAG TPA: lytic transglycosylase domain-containing protein [Solirubrobacteraceae bacterium]|nr:lytic transglycosylase domain-containing protein [Solirubrobacteraceae bacterium]
MPPIATSGTARRGGGARAAARRRTIARRRRRVLAVVGLAATAFVVILTAPLFRKAVTEFNLPLTNADVIRQQAAEKHLDPALIAGVIYAETKFDPRPSTAGAQGLMQILPQTAEFLAHKSGATTFTVADLGTPQVNIAYGSYYLRFLLDHYGGKTVLALAAYNGGEANVDRWVADARRHGHQMTIRAIPFPETRAYVQRVLHAQRQYRHTYASQLGYR